jgi:hypothetical protein
MDLSNRASKLRGSNTCVIGCFGVFSLVVVLVFVVCGEGGRGDVVRSRKGEGRGGNCIH